MSTRTRPRLNCGSMSRKSGLPPDMKERLIALAGRHVTSNGVLIVVSRAHRSQVENRDAARAGLGGALEASRQATKEAQGDESEPGRARENEPDL